MATTANLGLLSKDYLTHLLFETEAHIYKLQVSLGGYLQSFFNVLHKKQQQPLDFSGIQSLAYIQELRNHITKFRNQEQHKYKRLHYTYIMSRLMERELEIMHHAGEKMNTLDQLNHIVQPGDFMLISYRSTGFSRDSLIGNFASNLLRFFSSSLFAHIGIIGSGDKKKGYNWIHSTFHKDGGRSGVKRTSLTTYLNTHNPADILILRYKGDKKEEIVKHAQQHAQQETEYDTRDAVGDISGFNYLRDEDKLNCGELVYMCLKSVQPDIDIEKKGLPSAYIHAPMLEHIYLNEYIA